MIFLVVDSLAVGLDDMIIKYKSHNVTGHW